MHFVYYKVFLIMAWGSILIIGTSSYEVLAILKYLVEETLSISWEDLIILKNIDLLDRVVYFLDDETISPLVRCFT